MKKHQSSLKSNPNWVKELPLETKQQKGLKQNETK